MKRNMEDELAAGKRAREEAGEEEEDGQVPTDEQAAASVPDAADAEAGEIEEPAPASAGAAAADNAAADAAAAGMMSTPAIHAMIDEREEARRRKDYARSDAMRDELRSAGVNIDDRLRTWTASDGRTGSMPALGAKGGGPPPPAYAPSGGHPGYGHASPPGYGAPPAAYGHPDPAAYHAYYEQQQQYAAYYGHPGGYR